MHKKRFSIDERRRLKNFKEIDTKKLKLWFKDYVKLLEYKKDFYYGNIRFRKCIKNPVMDKSGLLIGIHK